MSRKERYIIWVALAVALLFGFNWVEFAAMLGNFDAEGRWGFPRYLDQQRSKLILMILAVAGAALMEYGSDVVFERFKRLLWLLVAIAALLLVRDLANKPHRVEIDPVWVTLDGDTLASPVRVDLNRP
jgi:hypothetical protein